MGTEQNETVPEVDEATHKAYSNQTYSRINGSVGDQDVNSESNEVNNPVNAVKDSHGIPHIYRQDVVRNNKTGLIGVVNEVAGDSDSDSSIFDDEEDEDDEDDDGENEEGSGDESRYTDGIGNTNRGNDNYKSGSLETDQVRVIWIDDTESTHNLNEVTVVDREFLHGDYVAAASDPTGQVGVVVDVNINVDLLAPDGSVIKDVSSRDLKRVRDFTSGDYVIFGPWLGRVDDVLDNVTVLFDDGSVCKVMRADPLRLKPISKNMFEDGHCPYYPGQRVRASSSSLFKNARWLSGAWKPNRLEGTAIKVSVGSVFVYWIASAGYGPNSSTSPAEEQSSKNLKLLSCFTHASWQLGDWCLIQSSALASSMPFDKYALQSDSDCTRSGLDSSQIGNGCDSEVVAVEESNENGEVIDLDQMSALNGNNPNAGSNTSPVSSSCGSSLSVAKEVVHETWPLHRKKIRKVVVRRDKKNRKKEENFERAVLIVYTQTKVDVMWQNGVLERGLDSTMLIPIDSPGDHEFVSEQYVVEKASDNEDEACEVSRVGIVKSVNAKERTACVLWLKPVDRAEDPREFEKEEIVSVYELEGHPDYDYCYGDVVIRLSPVSSQMASAGDIEDPKQQTELNEAKQGASSDEACTDFSDLSWVGNITGLKNGDIEVVWADGVVSTVGPQAIYVVGRDDDDESVGGGSQVSDNAASWETVDDDEMYTLEDSKEELELQCSTGTSHESKEKGENNSGRNSALFLPLAALGFVTRLATGIFSRGRKTSDPDSLDSKGDIEDQPERVINISEGRDSGDKFTSKRSNFNEDVGMGPNCEKKEQIAAEVLVSLDAEEAAGDSLSKTSDAPACYEEELCSFKRFDIATDPFDNHFLGANGQSNSGRKWLKKVHQDWNILQNNLPHGIYVRVYEDRMDLLRGVIVGAYGTPYQDGLFFFDIHLPPEYPDVPPSAHYHSGGWRINPNLYEEGKVCLSLLNTWTGRGNEVWDPSSSSILQVLVSLQGLVLNARPYFNEAGYDKQVGTAEGEKNSLSYNENTFLLNCKAMMYLMRRPPKDFEELVKDHFRSRGHYILKACDAYMKGYLIGSLTEDSSISNENNANSTSVGFKLMLTKIVPKLFTALRGIGANCLEFEHLQEP